MVYNISVFLTAFWRMCVRDEERARVSSRWQRCPSTTFVAVPFCAAAVMYQYHPYAHLSTSVHFYPRLAFHSKRAIRLGLLSLLVNMETNYPTTLNKKFNFFNRLKILVWVINFFLHRHRFHCFLAILRFYTIGLA